MELHKKFFLVVCMLCSAAVAATGISTQRSAMGLSELREDVSAQQSTPDKLFWIADEFGQMRLMPGFTFGAPSGLVPGWGVAYGGIAGTTDNGVVNGPDEDGGVAFGMGWGDPVNFVGGAIDIGIGSINPKPGDAFDRGNLNVSVGHIFRDFGLGLAIGATNIDLWHNSGDMRVDQSLYFSASKLLPNDIAPLIVTAGFGDNGFVDIDRKLTEEERRDKVGPFASIAAYVLPQVSIILDYTSGITTLGTSIVPFPDYPIVIDLAAHDLAEERPSDEVSFVGSIGAGFSFD